MLKVGEFDWMMSTDGLLAVAWKDVGLTKGMCVSYSFYHTHTHTHTHPNTLTHTLLHTGQTFTSPLQLLSCAVCPEFAVVDAETRQLCLPSTIGTCVALTCVTKGGETTRLKGEAKNGGIVFFILRLTSSW